MTSPGSQIEGKYEVFGKLREGGMGAIYIVRHRLLDELRIIKVMRPEVAESADQRKRFLREAQMATRLKHANIVGFYDFFVDDEGTAYMVMEYIDGINLRDMTRSRGPLPISLGLFLARQCLSALDYLHRKGVVHRDIAPDNIMMTQEEDGTLQAKLIDLGIAKLQRTEEQEQLTAADEFIGKLRYSSPEQLTKKASSTAIDGRSDLFSFGIVLYEALTGICPYGGGSIQDILTSRLQKPPMPFSLSDPKGRVGAQLRGAILKALQTKPEDRYQTALEFSRALEALADSEASPDSPQQVQQYVVEAIETARKAAAAASPGAVSGMQRTLQSKFRMSEVSIRPLEATDLRVEKTIARLGGDTTPPPTQANQASPDPQKTMAYAGPRGASGAPTDGARAGTHGLMGYVLAALGAAALVVLGIVVSVFLSDRNRPERVTPAPSRAKAIASSLPLEPPRPKPESQAPEGTTAPSVVPVPTAPAAAVVEPSPASTSAERQRARHDRAERAPAPRRVPQMAAPADTRPNPSRPKMRFCSEPSRTAYIQGVPKEVPPGFKDVAGLPAREDSGRIKINISVLPESPSEGEEFVVVAAFVNGGDGSFRLARVEESAPSARGGFEPLSGIATPTTVDEGGKLEIFRSRRVLGAGDTYHKTFRVVEQRRNDVWEASVTVKPCVEQ